MAEGDVRSASDQVAVTATRMLKTNATIRLTTNLAASRRKACRRGGAPLELED